MSPPKLATFLKLGDPGTAAAMMSMRRHGAAIAPFLELIVRFGEQARADVVLLHQILGAPSATLAQSAWKDGWEASRRLLELARKMPHKARERAGYHVESSMLALAARENEFGVAWTDEITAVLREARGDPAQWALKVAARDLAGAKTLARLSADLPDATTELKALWVRLFKAVPLTDAGLVKAAALAAEFGPSMRSLLTSTTGGSAEQTKRLWGYLSQVRGALGEAYALGDKAWLAIKEEELLRAHVLAAQLGPGYEVRCLTQAADELLLNGLDVVPSRVVDAGDGWLAGEGGVSAVVVVGVEPVG